MKTSGGGGGKKDDSLSSSLECPISLDQNHDDDYDWKPKGNKNVDVGGRKSGPDLQPETKPPQHDPGIHYPQPKVRIQKYNVPDKKKRIEMAKKQPEE